jgi:hypothetical protein
LTRPSISKPICLSTLDGRLKGGHDMDTWRFPMPVRQLSDGNPDGNVLGQSASDLISFYNAGPIAQRSGAAQAAVPTTAPTNSSPYGYSQAQATAIITLLNEIRATLVGLGLMKGQ